MNSIAFIPTTLARWAAIGGCLLAAVSAGAAERKVAIEAPAKIGANTNFTVVVTASTDAAGGEQVGFFQVDASLDGGATWAAQAYLDKLGAAVKRPVHLKSGAAGSVVKVRVRVAFRNGNAKDVDYTGAAIRWSETWEKWAEPPTKSATIKVE